MDRVTESKLPGRVQVPSSILREAPLEGAHLRWESVAHDIVVQVLQVRIYIATNIAVRGLGLKETVPIRTLLCEYHKEYISAVGTGARRVRPDHGDTRRNSTSRFTSVVL